MPSGATGGQGVPWLQDGISSNSHCSSARQSLSEKQLCDFGRGTQMPLLGGIGGMQLGSVVGPASSEVSLLESSQGRAIG